MNNSILTNLTNLSICNDLKSANSLLSRSLERMASGLKINNAKDDTSGCVISSKIKNKLSGTYQAQKNLQNGMSMLNVASGAYQNMSNILLRLRDISLSAMNDSYDKTSRQAFEDEANELTNELEQIRRSTEYNGISLFNSSVITEESTNTQLATPEATNFSMRYNLMPKSPDTERVSGGGTFEYDSDGNNKVENVNNSNQEVENNNLALASLDDENGAIEEVPMMMSARASVTPIEETTIIFNDEAKIINIGNNSYRISGEGEFKYKQDSNGQITFSGSGQGFSIKTLNSEANNIIIKCNYARLFLNSADDIVDIKGTACHVTSEGGNNEIKISAVQSRVILNGNGNDTLYSSSSAANQYIYLGEGDDNISNLKINNSVVTKKSGNVNYNLSNLKNCSLYNISEFDSDLKFIEVGTENSTITVNGKQYNIKNRDSNIGQHLFYKYDTEKQRATFIGYNTTIYAKANTSEKSLLYGVDSAIYGTSKNDDILIGVGSFHCDAYGNDGDDLLVTEEFTTAYSNYLYGGNGNDTLIGNSKTGYWGENGNDTIIINASGSSSGATGGQGNDTFEVNSKIDIFDTSGDNTFYINTNDITADLGGTSGTFIINGSNNNITGTDGDDYFEINGSNNSVNGGSGDDYYINNNASNTTQNALDAKTNGKLIFNAQNEEQSIEINGKIYTITNNSNSTNTLYWNYSNGEILITGSDFDIVANNDIEHAIVVDGSNNIIEGGNKNDSITIRNGENNYIFGNRGNDNINLNYKNNSADGGIGNDKININATTNLNINGNIGNDIINLNANDISNILCSDGDDRVVGTSSNSKINLGSGDNTVELIGNNNSITGGNDKNSINLEGDSNKIQVGGEIDFDIKGNSNQFVATSGSINGELEGNNNYANFENADSSIIRIEGNENNLSGASGSDKITIAGNKNIANGNDGNDNFIIDEGDSNRVNGGKGRNTIYDIGTNTTAINTIDITPKPLDIDLHIGADSGSTEVISTRLLFTIGDFELNFETSENAAKNIAKIDKLLKQINEQMSSIGSALNRLDSIYELQNKEIENLSLTKSLIIDTDIASETSTFAKTQILKEVSTSLFSQSNNITKNLALKLLTG